MLHTIVYPQKFVFSTFFQSFQLPFIAKDILQTIKLIQYDFLSLSEQKKDK